MIIEEVGWFHKLPQIIGEKCVRLMFMYLLCVYTLWFMQINSAVSYHPLLHRNLFSCVFCCSYDGNAWRNCTQPVVSVCKSDTILWKLSHQRVNWTGWELYKCALQWWAWLRLGRPVFSLLSDSVSASEAPNPVHTQQMSEFTQNMFLQCPHRAQTI